MKKVLLVLVTIFWALCAIGAVARIFWELPKPVLFLMVIGYISMAVGIIYRYRQVNKKKQE